MGAKRCPHCGVQFGRTWHVPLNDLSTSSSGWGFSPTTYSSFIFRVMAIFTPVWVPLIAALIAVDQSKDAPVALAILLTPFIFIPGVYTVANLPGLSGPIRFFASLLYVAISAVVGFIVLSMFIEFLR